VAELRTALATERERSGGGQVALVPTMGSLHEGHLSLVRAARARAETVVVSLFVNPAQFAAGEDLDSYPRDETRDAALARAAGADLLFAPPVSEIYPEGFDTVVRVRGLSEVLCGSPESRGAQHFDGVTTVVTKLFNLVRPEIAFFGQKDAQQALVIERLVRDLDMGVRIELCPTVREPDGLAMSSRNAHLTPSDRPRALALERALSAAEAAVAAGQRDAGPVLAAARAELDAAGVEPEYLELRRATDLAPAEHVNGSTLLAVAARVGRARLIDNRVLAAGEPRPATSDTGGSR
jgi:pantoate--beta-alanine ligase